MATKIMWHENYIIVNMVKIWLKGLLRVDINKLNLQKY